MAVWQSGARLPDWLDWETAIWYQSGRGSVWQSGQSGDVGTSQAQRAIWQN